MENLKYPKKSYFIEDLGIANFEVIGSKAVFKQEAIILPKTGAVEKLHVTKDGASGARFLEFKSDATCYTECDYSFGFAIKRKYRTPGVGNEYPRNHARSRSYYNTISPVDITSGVISEANIRKMEAAILGDIKADHDFTDEGKFFKAFKYAVVSVKTASADVVLDGVTITGLTFGETQVNAEDGIVAIERTDGTVLIIATADGSNFEIGTVTAGSVLSQGIMVAGLDPAISFDIHHSDTMNVSFGELFILKAPAVTGKTYVVRLLNAVDGPDAITFASAAAFSSAKVDSAVGNDGFLYITSKAGADTINELVVLPGTATTVYPEMLLLASGGGCWPTMTTEALRRRFLGRYKGQFGVEQHLPSAKRHVEVYYIISGTTAAATGGASTDVGFKTRVSFVVSYEVYTTNAAFIALT